MGHNFGNVGEEYDGGSVYSGANSARTLATITWRAWLTEPAAPIVEQNTVQKVQAYAWTDLARGPVRYTWTSDGTFPRNLLRFSASGCETPGSLRITLDGVIMPWTTKATLDRSFYEYSWPVFTAGSHSLVFEQGTPPSAPQIRQLCNVNLHEYKAESQYKLDNNYIGAYPTWSSSNAKTYRPNNERCLMRNMTSRNFCVVCQENNWHQFFRRMTLIDNLAVTYPGANATVVLTPVPLAQFRPTPILGERYLVTWIRNGLVDPTIGNIFSWSRPRASVTGNWVVNVEFQTPEVRVDTSNLLKATRSFTI